MKIILNEGLFTMKPNRSFRSEAFLLATLLVSLAVVAQFQVNTQVNQPLYSGGSLGSVQYSAGYTSNMLPSEVRYHTWKSGALPSEIQANALAVGPLSSGGRADYIPVTRSGWMVNSPPPYYTGSVRYSSPGAFNVNPAISTGHYMPARPF